MIARLYTSENININTFGTPKHGLRIAWHSILGEESRPFLSSHTSLENYRKNCFRKHDKTNHVIFVVYKLKEHDKHKYSYGDDVLSTVKNYKREFF